MYFTELKVKGFGQHIERVVKFTPGLNVLVGESEVGKTMLIRALYLLIENSPRGGEKLYQSWFTDEPLSIQLRDNQGNTVKRKNNKYYLNGGDPLKAFGTSVPEPIRQLFNFKEINWQKQLHPHYLLFSTGGSAGKILNNATGMAVQELLITEIKSDLSDSKSEIKRLKKNNDEYQQTLERLRHVTRFRIKAEAIINIQNNAIEIEKKADRLENILIQLEEIRKIKNSYKKVEKHMDTLNQILEDYKEVDVYKAMVNKLIGLLNKINEIEIFDHVKVIDYLQRLQRLESLNFELTTAKTTINLLEKYIREVKEQKEFQEKYLIEMKQVEKELENTFIQLGYCPFCNREIKDGDTCCRG